MAKKKKEPIIIQKTELMPTTIGVLSTKENGPLFVIILIVILLVGIFFLDKIQEGIESFLNPAPVISGPVNPTPPSIEEPTESPEIPPEETDYYIISDNLSINIEGFQIHNIEVLPESNLLRLRITNVSGKSNQFLNNNYYIELYSAEKTFLQRLKIDNITISNYRNFNFDISQASLNGVVAEMNVVLKTENDYPAVVLRKDSSGTPFLTCKKDNQTFSYYFSEGNNQNQLEFIEETTEFTMFDDNYRGALEDYSAFIEELEDVDGVESEIRMTDSGFAFFATIYLDILTPADKSAFFNETPYFKYNSEAKLIQFELESSGFTCE